MPSAPAIAAARWPAPKQMTGKVFISHSSRDKVKANRIVADIEKRGIPCWISARLSDLQPGQDYQKRIFEAIEPALAVVLLFSSNANSSEDMAKETALASRLRKPLIPVKIEDSEPEGAFAYQMAAAQYINLYEDYQGSIDELCSRLAELAASGAPAAQTPPRRAASNSRRGGSWAVAAVLIVAVLGGVGWTQQARLRAMLAPQPSPTAAAAPAPPPVPASSTAVITKPVVAPVAAPVPQAPPVPQVAPVKAAMEQPAGPVKTAVEQPAVAPAKTTPPAAANVPPQPAAEPGYTAINNTALRATADPYGETVETIEVGDTVRATANDQTDPAWIHVTAQDGQTGYVSRADVAAQ